MTVTREEVEEAYRFFLEREPESERAINFHMHLYKDVHSLREALFNSPEYKSKEKERKVLEAINQKMICPIKFQDGKALTFFINPENPYDDTIGKALKRSNTALFKEVFQAMNFVKEKSVFIDIGANLGIWSIPFAANGFQVYGFEANALNYTQLKKTNDINGLSCKFFCCAVTDRVGVFEFISYGPWGHIVNADLGRIIGSSKNAIGSNDFVLGITIDEWYKECPFPEKVSLIKMDVEGYEIQALNGMKTFLKEKDFPLCFVESMGWKLVAQKKEPQDLIQAFGAMGYIPCRIREDGQVLEKIEDFLQPRCVEDILFVHESTIDEYPVEADTRDHEARFFDYAFKYFDGLYQYIWTEVYYHAYTILNNKRLWKNARLGEFMSCLSECKEPMLVEKYEELLAVLPNVNK